MSQEYPTLRFKEFQFELYKRAKLSGLLLSSKLGGNYVNTVIPSEFPLIKMGNLGRSCMDVNKVEYISENEQVHVDDLMKHGDLFFNTRNTLSLVGKVAIWKGELPVAYYNSNLLRLEFKNNFFFNYLLNAPLQIKKFKSIACGTTSVAAIYTKDLIKVQLNIPLSDKEQQKIADFLTAVDSKISQLTEKHRLLKEYKKGVMQQLFSQKIRFKDDDGKAFPDWNEDRLDSFIQRVNDPVDVEQTKKYRQIGIRCHGKGLFHKDKVTGAELGNKRVFWVHTKALIINIVFAWERAVAVTSESENGFVASHRFPMFVPIEGKSDLDYLLYFFLSPRGEYLLNLASPGGAGRNKTLGQAEFARLKLNLPSLAEQLKIAQFLQSIDKKVDAVALQIEQTKLFKKGLLQQMFV